MNMRITFGIETLPAKVLIALGPVLKNIIPFRNGGHGTGDTPEELFYANEENVYSVE